MRDHLNLVGTKFGCGIAQCGACTVHINGSAVRSCSFPIAAVGDYKVTTIEGLSADGTHPVQKAWEQIDVPQCGYCQAGQIMAASALLKKNPHPTDKDIDDAMTNICRAELITAYAKLYMLQPGRALPNDKRTTLTPRLFESYIGSRWRHYVRL